jgi:hypothetical protein
MKLEVVAGVYAETILMLNIMLLLLLLLLLLLKLIGGGGALLERGLQLPFSQLALITASLYRPFEELFHFSIKFLLLH